MENGFSIASKVERGSSLPESRVHAVEHGNNQGGVIDGETFVQADDLTNCSHRQEDEGEHDRGMPELIARVLM